METIRTRQLEEENTKLRAVLKKLVAMNEHFTSEDNGDRLTYSGAYYAFYKGQYATWDEAKALLSNTRDEGTPGRT